MVDVIDWDSQIEVVTDDKHKCFLERAYAYAWHHSGDSSTKVGAVIVAPSLDQILAYGANHYSPRLSATEEEKADRGWKLKNITHAEPAAIYTAARKNGRTEGAVMYMPWVPCENCARAIVGAGIERIIGHKDMIVKTPNDWWGDIGPALALLKRCGVGLYMYDGKIGNVKGLFRGKEWEP